MKNQKNAMALNTALSDPLAEVCKDGVVYVRCETLQTTRYSYDQLMAARRYYSVQNLLLNSYNFPQYYYVRKDDPHQGDDIASVYIDRLPAEKRRQIEKHPKGNHFEFYAPGQLLALAKLIFSREDITGVQVVEFTNVSNGYPLFRVDAFSKSEETPPSGVLRNKTAVWSLR